MLTTLCAMPFTLLMEFMHKIFICVSSLYVFE